MPPRDIGVATSSATFFRQIGGTLGVAVFLSLLFSTLGEQHQERVQAAAAGDPAFRQAGQTRHPLNDQALPAVCSTPVRRRARPGAERLLDHRARCPAVLAHPFKVGFADSMSLVLLGGGCVMLIAFLVLLLMPKVELRATSAGAAARAEQRAAEAATD